MTVDIALIPPPRSRFATLEKWPDTIRACFQFQCSPECICSLWMDGMPFVMLHILLIYASIS
ncbi:MAG: hypothetical protein NWR47_07925 [Aestuariivirgaceae bacterium]|nr:hypothetical protein [Aestuariivirgaceae bacterium]